MKSVRLLTPITLALLLAAPFSVQAQVAAPQDQTAPQQAAAPVNPAAPAASDAAAPVAAVTTDSGAPTGSPANPIPQSSPTPAGQAGALVAGDPNVVSNGPVPDTKANRALYGKPLSAAGRATQPAGN